MEQENILNYFDRLFLHNSQLKDSFLQYLILKSNLKATYQKEENESDEDLETRIITQMPTEDRPEAIRIQSNLKTMATSVMIELTSLKISIDKTIFEKLEKNYKIITETDYPNTESCKEFVQDANDLIVKIINAPSLITMREKMKQLANIGNNN